MKTALAVLVAASVASTQADAFCFAEAAERYGVSSDLLRAIARVESGLNPSAINTTHEGATGSVDLGLMQINSSHLPRLSIRGITRERLLHDACLNVMVGAWLLVQHMVRHGQDWNGIGSYNASCSKLKGDACAQARNSYAWKVYRALKSPRTTQPQSPVPLPEGTAAEPRRSIRSLVLAESTPGNPGPDEANSQTDVR